tara:strand:- start:154 stop:1443 length:1290 start_codon:yes stop_codon:yes gene_type:complete
MINKSGLSGMVKNLGSPSSTNIPKKEESISSTSLVSARVTDIILDENHPLFNEFGGWSSIGTIIYEVENLTAGGQTSAKPLFPQQNSFPLVNELVVLIELPSNNIGADLSSKDFYYINSISLWNHPHHNAYPNPLNNSLPPSQQQDYQQVEGGSVRRVTDGSTEIDLNSPSNPSQNTFIEKTNIHPLLSFPGDILYEGRWGNSLRFGSTAKSNSEYVNNWSSTGNNGDPIVVLRNGQSVNTSNEGWVPITEDINTDLSSIYLTSTQKLPIDRNWVDKFNNFHPLSKPISLSSYSQPQILMNSNRVVLNAKTDSILISGEQHFNVAVGKYVNIDSENLYIDAEITKLGAKNATEPVLKGDTTVELLKKLTKAIKDLAKILEVENSWPGGQLKTGYNVIAGGVLTSIEEITDQLNANKGENSLKSQTTQVK